MQQANFMPKLGADFVLGNSKATVSILFSRYLAKRYAHTFQVQRSVFDELMLNHAAESSGHARSHCGEIGNFGLGRINFG